MPKPKGPPKLASLEEIEQTAKQSPDLPEPKPVTRYDAGTPIVDLVENERTPYPTNRNIPGKPDYRPDRRISIPKLEQFARHVAQGSTIVDAMRACYPASVNWAPASVNRRGMEASRLTRTRVNWLLQQEATQADVTPAMIENHLWQLAQAGRQTYVDKYGSQRLVDGSTSARAADSLARIKGMINEGRFNLAADAINISMDFGSGAAPVVDVQAAEVHSKPATGLESGQNLAVDDQNPENGEA